MEGKVDGLPKEIEIVSWEYLNRRKNSPLPPTLFERPAAAMEGQFFQVYPKAATDVTLIYLRRPKQPYYLYEANATTDLPDYVATQEFVSEGAVTVTNAGAAGDTISVTESVGTLVLGKYTVEDGDTISSIAAMVVADINKRSVAHGYLAELTNVAGVIKVYAPTGTGVDGDSLTLAVTAVGTVAASVTSIFAGGIAGSTQIELEERDHEKVTEVILFNMGFNLSNEMLKKYMAEAGIQSV